MRRSLLLFIASLLSLVSACGNTRTLDGSNMSAAGAGGASGTGAGASGEGGASGSNVDAHENAGSGGVMAFGGAGGTQAQEAGVSGGANAGVSGGDYAPGPGSNGDAARFEFVDGDHEGATCAAGACPFVSDVVMRSSNATLGEGGVWVASVSDGAMLFTSTTSKPFLLTSKGQERAVRELATLNAFGGVGQTQDGTMLGVCANKLFRDDGAAWTSEDTVSDSRGLWGPNGFAVAPDGTMHLWFDEDGPVGGRHLELIRALDGTWSERPATPSAADVIALWTLDRSGAPVAIEKDYDLQLLKAHAGGTVLTLGAASGLSTQLSYFLPVPAAVPQASAGPDYAVVFQSYLGLLSVAWPDADAPAGARQIDVPDTTQLVVSSCTPSPQAGACEQDCVDEQNGVVIFAATQTSDGKLWVAWAEVERSWLFDYGEAEASCPTWSPDCYCTTEVTMRDTSTTLHLARVDFEANALTEVLTQPIDALGYDWNKINFGSRFLDMRAFGDRLAIGMRVVTEDASEDAPEDAQSEWLSAVRLIELDTSQF